MITENPDAHTADQIAENTTDTATSAAPEKHDSEGAQEVQEANAKNETAPAGGLRPDVGVRTDEQERIARGEMAVLRSAVDIRSQERALLARLEYQNASWWQRIGKGLGIVDESRARNTAAEQELRAQRERYRDAVNLVHAIRAQRIAELAPAEQKRMMEVITRDVFHEADRLYNAKTEARAVHLGIGKYMGPVGRFFQREDVRALCKKGGNIATIGAMGVAIAAGGVMTTLRYAPRLALAMGVQGPMVVAAAKLVGAASVGGGATLGGLAGYKMADRYGRSVLRKDRDATQTALLEGDAQQFGAANISRVVQQRARLRQKADRNKKVAGAAGAVAGGTLGYMLSGAVYGNGHPADDVVAQHGDAPESGGHAADAARPSTPAVEQPVEHEQQTAVQETAQQAAAQSAAEQLPAQAAETERVVFDIARGDTMWGRIAAHLTQHYPAFDQLTSAQKNIVIDHFEDQLQNLEASGNYAQLKEMGFAVSARVGHADVDMIRPNDHIDMTSILGNKADVQNVIEHARGAQGGGAHEAVTAVQSQEPPIQQSAGAGAPVGEQVAQQSEGEGVHVATQQSPVAQTPVQSAEAHVPGPESAASSAETASSAWAHAPRSISIPDAQEMSGLDQATFEKILSNNAQWHIAQTAPVVHKNAFDTWLMEVSQRDGMTPQNGETLGQYIARYNRLYEQHQGADAVPHESVLPGDGTIDNLIARELTTSVNPNALYDIRPIVAQPQFFGYADGDTRFSDLMRTTTVQAYAQTASQDIASAQWQALSPGDRHGRAWILSAMKIIPPEGDQETMGAYVDRFVRDVRGQEFEYTRLLTESPRAVQDMQSRVEYAVFGAPVPPEALAQPVNLSHLPQERQQAIITVLHDEMGITNVEQNTRAQLLHRIIGSGKAQSLVTLLRGM